MVIVCAWCRRVEIRKIPTRKYIVEYDICPKYDAMLRVKYRLIYPAALDADAINQKPLAKKAPW